eukprot:scaffold1680_cov391-Prasinococcus_capsulatus_cf.AAC.5
MIDAGVRSDTLRHLPPARRPGSKRRRRPRAGIFRPLRPAWGSFSGPHGPRWVPERQAPMDESCLPCLPPWRCTWPSDRTRRAGALGFLAVDVGVSSARPMPIPVGRRGDVFSLARHPRSTATYSVHTKVPRAGAYKTCIQHGVAQEPSRIPRRLVA